MDLLNMHKLKSEKLNFKKKEKQLASFKVRFSIPQKLICL